MVTIVIAQDHVACEKNKWSIWKAQKFLILLLGSFRVSYFSKVRFCISSQRARSLFQRAEQRISEQQEHHWGPLRNFCMYGTSAKTLQCCENVFWGAIWRHRESWRSVYKPWCRPSEEDSRTRDLWSAYLVVSPEMLFACFFYVYIWVYNIRLRRRELSE